MGKILELNSLSNVITKVKTYVSSKLDTTLYEKLTIKVSTIDNNSVEGLKVTINGSVYSIDSTGIVIAYIPYGIEYSIFVDSKDSYTNPPKITFIALQLNRRAALVYGGTGVYIQDVNHNLWTIDENFDGDYNGVVFINDKIGVLISSESTYDLDGDIYTLEGNVLYTDNSFPLENYMLSVSPNTANSYYEGLKDTNTIIEATGGFGDGADVAHLCKQYVFPDGKTVGYLPSVGELYEIFLNKEAIDEALMNCDWNIDHFYNKTWWSSTFKGVESDKRCCFIYGSEGRSYSFLNGKYLAMIFGKY